MVISPRTTGQPRGVQSGLPASPLLRLSLEERGADFSRSGCTVDVDGDLAWAGRASSTTEREVARRLDLNGYRTALAERLAVGRTARPQGEKHPGRLQRQRGPRPAGVVQRRGVNS